MHGDLGVAATSRAMMEDQQLDRRSPALANHDLDPRRQWCHPGIDRSGDDPGIDKETDLPGFRATQNCHGKQARQNRTHTPIYRCDIT